MRIAFIPSWFPTPTEPTQGIFFADRASALASRHDVVTILPRIVSFRSRSKSAIIMAEKDGYRVVQAISRPLIPRCGYGNRLGLLRACKLAIAVAERDFGYFDLFFALHADPAGWLAMRCSGKRKVPVVLFEGASFTADFAAVPYYSWIKRAFVEAATVIVPSHFLADRLRSQKLREDIVVIPNLIRTDFFTPLKNELEMPKIPRILSVANLVSIKGVSDLIMACALIRNKSKRRLELRIVGDGPLRAQLELLVNQLGLDGACTFLGQLSREAVRDEMRACRVFVTSSYTETFGIALGEAMACGKPVVATRCGGPEEFVTPECGVLVPVKDPESLAEAICEVLGSPHRFSAELIRKHIEKFGPSHYVNNATDVFCETLQPYS